VLSMAVYGGEPKIRHKHIANGVTANDGSMADKQKNLIYIHPKIAEISKTPI
jgi:hypothetical protein